MLMEILIGLVAFFGCIYLYLTRHYGYWKKKGVVFIEPRFPFGTTHNMFWGKEDAGTTQRRWYTQYKSQGHKYVGAFMFQQPSLIILDLDLCKQVLTKDFNHFVSRDFGPTSHEYISKHLFALEGLEWKNMRTKLTPTFTSGKIKGMFTLMEKCAGQLQQHIDDVILKQEEFEVKDLMARFTTDIIATCAFGLEVNSIKERENEFYKTGQLIFRPGALLLPKLMILRTFPITSSLLKINFFDPRVTEVLSKIMKDTVEYRAKNNVSRNDFVDLLTKVRENKSFKDEDEETNSNGKERKTCMPHYLLNGKHESNQKDGKQLTLEEMTAQAFVFFAAGFETAASTTSFCLYELAMNPEVQDKLRREIDEVLLKHGGQLTYQALQDMTYMDQVMNEGLRLYASLPLLTRTCTERYQFPDTDLVLDKGIKVIIPAYSIHHDPDIYPDPYKFDPDRFSEENSKQRHNYAFIPFGEGPRNCIGIRFGRLQVKVGLAAILSRYELSPAPDTPSRLEIEPKIIFTTAKHPFSLKITKRPDV